MIQRLAVTLFLSIPLAIALSGCSSDPAPEVRVVDEIENRLVILRGERTGLHNFYRADFVVLGGGMGGIAAALSICSAGRTVILVEESDQVAGCFADDDTTRIAESGFVDSSGTSRTFQDFRSRIRDWYHTRSKEQPRFDMGLSETFGDFPGGEFCFESEAALQVIEDMLAQNIERGKLTVLRRHKVARVINFNNRVASLEAVDLDSLVVNQITAWMFVDATRTGYLYPLAGIEHRPQISQAAIDSDIPVAANAGSDSLWNVFYVPRHDTPLEKDKYDDVVIDTLSPVPTATHTEPVRVLKEPLHLEARYMITEDDIAQKPTRPQRGEFFRDSVGIGYHPIIREFGGRRLVIPTQPFQIPLKSLVPVTFTNVLAGGWTLGATSPADRAFRSPLVEWAVGEAAGEAAAYCAGYNIYLDKLVADESRIRALQEWLVIKRGAPIYWYSDVSPQDKDFKDAQMRPFLNPDFHRELEARRSLRFHPGSDDRWPGDNLPGPGDFMNVPNGNRTWPGDIGGNRELQNDNREWPDNTSVRPGENGEGQWEQPERPRPPR